MLLNCIHCFCRKKEQVTESQIPLFEGVVVSGLKWWKTTMWKHAWISILVHEEIFWSELHYLINDLGKNFECERSICEAVEDTNWMLIQYVKDRSTHMRNAGEQQLFYWTLPSLEMLVLQRTEICFHWSHMRMTCLLIWNHTEAPSELLDATSFGFLHAIPSFATRDTLLPPPSPQPSSSSRRQWRNSKRKSESSL